MSDKPKCRGPECDRDMTARQLCNAHVQQLYAGKELTPIRKAKSLEQSLEEYGQEPELKKSDLEVVRDALRVLEKHLEGR